ncbi:MAG: motility associated factor glycosyltransferase family protein [Lachnospiraceae bacterium]|nr:motility associated factor glycosyltransferase family protein [Lachnospiraceae bacterium]
MTAQIKNLFQTNIELLELVDKAVFYFREQNYPAALEYMPVVSEKMKDVIDGIIGDKEYFQLVSTDSLTEMLEGIVEASRSVDYVLLADLLELQLSTLICNVQELIIKKENYAFFSESMYLEQCTAMVEKLAEAGQRKEAETLFETTFDPEQLMEAGYRVEATSCGLMTVAVKTDRGSIYLHSNHKAVQEAFLLARSWVSEGVETYLVKGFGMGYHVLELAKLVPEAKIKVFESDGQILKLACAFSPLRKLLENDRISICYDPEGTEWKREVEQEEEGKAFCLHMPSVQAGSALF